MPTRVLCKTKTGKITKKNKDGSCPKGTSKKTIRVKARKKARGKKK